MLKKNSRVAEDDGAEYFQSSDRLAEDEVKKFQNKLARSIIVFLELLHLLIARNRDLLLSVIQEKKKENPTGVPPPPSGMSRAQSAMTAINGYSPHSNNHNRPALSRLGSHESVEPKTTGGLIRSVSEDPTRVRSHMDHRPTHSQADDNSYAGTTGSLSAVAGNVRNDSAIAVAVQSELQRSFITLTKTLYPGISGIMQTETPRWIKQCCQDNYFSLGTYRQTRLRKFWGVCFGYRSQPI